MWPEEQAGDHRRSGEKQESVGRIHSRDLLLQNEIEDDPNCLIAKPKPPSRSLKNPKPADAALAGGSVPGKCKEGAQHQ
jgi:hypothetical protein